MKAIALGSALSLIAAPSGSAVLPSNFEQQVDAIFADYSGAQPGCAVGVYRSGNLIFGKGYGLADLGTGEEITTSTVFNVASLTKQFTAFAIALLAREGRISLDSEVQTHVPELPRFQAPITIRHLVHHTSGLRDYGALFELTGWRFDQPLPRAEVLALLRRQRGLNFATGTRHEYNNSNYLLLALIVERVTGQTLAQFTQERMFRPLQMSHTLYRDDPDSPRPARAANYTRHADGQWAVNHVWDRGFGAGAVGLHTSIEDLGRWDGNSFAPTVGDAALIRTLTSPSALSSGERLDYGFGLDLSPYRGLPAVSHAGQGGGTFYLMRLPDRQLGIATLCNRYSLGPYATDSATLTWAVADLLLGPPAAGGTGGAAALAPEITMPPERLAAHVGDYWSHVGAPIRLRLQGGRLVELLEGKADPLIPVARGRFRSPDGKGTYEFSGERDHVLTYREPAVDHVFTGERRPAWTPSSAVLASTAGRYCSPEVPVCWSLLPRARSLTLRRSGFPDRVLEPAWADTFTLIDTDDIGTRTMRLGLRRASDGTITGFNLSRGRITGLVFDKR
jgi:CubicO group peptidase (beta-lactamase class C family)